MLEAIGGAVPPPLRALRARGTEDPAVALCDAWAVVLDLLGFYTDRIAEEGYLETARERRSLVELARLMAYAPRPGVAATGWLAFEIDGAVAGPVDLPAGLQVNSVPGPGEAMVTFESDAPITARAAWNAMAPRRSRPQTWADVKASGLWLDGVALALKPGDPLLVDHGDGGPPQLHRIHAVALDAETRRTRVVIVGTKAAQPTRPPRPDEPRSGLLTRLRRRPVRAGAASPHLALAEGGESLPRLLAGLDPALGTTLPAALGGFRAPAPERPLRAWALRVTAPLFGHNAPLRQEFSQANARQPLLVKPVEWDLFRDAATDPPMHVEADKLTLEGTHPILPGSLIAIENHPYARRLVVELDREPGRVSHISVASFGMSGAATEILLPEGTTEAVPERDRIPFTPLRRVRVHAASEPLALAPMPIEACIGEAEVAPGTGETILTESEIELDGLVEGLDAGRAVIVTGERCDLRDAEGEPIRGVAAAEFARIAEVMHRPRPGLGDRPHTMLRLAAPLVYTYRRASVAVHANVVPASHGATRSQVLGGGGEPGGDPGTLPPAFTLRPPPLGHLPAPVPAGALPTLELRVDGVRWHAVERLSGQGPRACLSPAAAGGRHGDGAVRRRTRRRPPAAGPGERDGALARRHRSGRQSPSRDAHLAGDAAARSQGRDQPSARERWRRPRPRGGAAPPPAHRGARPGPPGQCFGLRRLRAEFRRHWQGNGGPADGGGAPGPARDRGGHRGHAAGSGR